MSYSNKITTKFLELKKSGIRLPWETSRKHVGFLPKNMYFTKGSKHLLGACFDYINEPLELSSSQHKRNTCGANFNILPRMFNRVKGGCTFSVTTSKCCNHPLRRIRTSSSVNILKNVLYKHLRLGQIRDRTFIPFSSNQFLTECVIIGYL